MSDIKTVAIIQARMGSSRLPGKVLMDIAGKPMLEWVVSRVRQARRVHEVLVATTSDTSDDPVADFCQDKGIQVYRGSTFDVLDRYYQAARQSHADTVVRVTADCPLIDPQEIDTLLVEFFDRQVDFAANRLPPPWQRTFPIGLDTEIASFAALERAWKEASQKHDREHVMPYLYEVEGRFKIYYHNTSPDYGQMRWTVDTPEDLQAIRLMFSHLADKEHFTWHDVLDVVQQNPDLSKVNAGIKHKVFNEVDSRMEQKNRDVETENPQPLITIFTAPKPFVDPHINLIQRNAIVSWMNLGKEVEIFLVGNESGVEDIAREFGVGYLPEVKRNSQGTPLVSSIFDLARKHSRNPVLAYLNADIITLPDIIAATKTTMQISNRFLLVGQRWDIDIQESLQAGNDLTPWLENEIKLHGQLHPQGGSDYFVFPRDTFTEVPDFAIGRAGWDNWMIFHAREAGMLVINSTGAINIIHQQHDYRHLPGGKPHYRTPETFENVKLAGGKRTIFDLNDCTHRFTGGKVTRKPVTWKRFWREVEVFPLVAMKSKTLAQVSYAVFHPQKAYRELRAWLRARNSVKVE